MRSDDRGTVDAVSYWCRKCKEPVRLSGGAGVWPSLRRAVHEATGEETGPGHGEDGTHTAAPTDEDPVLRAQADALEAEFGGLFTISVRFRFFRADWANLPLGMTAGHYEASTADELRPHLLTAVRFSGTRAGTDDGKLVTGEGVAG